MRLSAALFAGYVLVGFVAPANASPQQIDAGYYRKYSCPQLLDEARQVSARAIAVTHDLVDANVANTAGAEAYIVIPAALTGPKPPTGELATLKQKLAAIQDATIQSQCQIEFKPSAR